MRANREKVIAWVGLSEGGFVDDPRDPGGRTNRGITQSTYNAWLKSQGRPAKDVRHITKAEAETILRDGPVGPGMVQRWVDTPDHDETDLPSPRVELVDLCPPEALPADYWRWWLLSHAPESGDSEFTWENFQASVNKDLADVLGNFVSRITKFTRAKFGETVPEGAAWGPREAELITALTERLGAYEGFMDAREVRKSAAELRAMWVLGNEYLQAAAPWSTIKTDPEAAAAQARMGLALIRLYAAISAPFIPFAAAAMEAVLPGIPADWPEGDLGDYLAAVQPGQAFAVPEVLFAKIADADREGWQARFASLRA